MYAGCPFLKGEHDLRISDLRGDLDGIRFFEVFVSLKTGAKFPISTLSEIEMD